MSADLVAGAVRNWMTAFGGSLTRVTIACSGGADSLALAVGAIAEIDDSMLDAVTVDHQLQDGSAGQAVRTAAQLHDIGYGTVRIDTVTVGSLGGPEAAARAARYQALRPDPEALGSAHHAVLLAHTADDQAETVLLGLGRGSGPRSIAGMSPWRAPWGRPLLGLRRRDTENACREAGLAVWADPQNLDPAFTRVRLRREVLPLLEDVLGGGVPGALARTASLLAEDLQALDHLAARLLADVWQTGGVVDLEALGGHPVALRRRALRAWADAVGAKALTAEHLLRLDALATGQRRNGAVRLPGALDAVRTGTSLRVVPVAPGQVGLG
jgi:tRNA(Ile)-lysidine synthase